MKKRDEQKLAKQFSDIADRILAGEETGDLANEELRAMTEKMKEIQQLTDQTAPSQAFKIRTRNLAMAAFTKANADARKKQTNPDPSMSEQFMSVISRLISEENFRTSFFSAPEETLQKAGFHLSPAEIAALKEMEPENLKNWMSDLDDRISKSKLM